MQSFVLLSVLFDDFKVSILTEEVSRFLPDTIRNASKWKDISFGDGTGIVFFRASNSTFRESICDSQPFLCELDMREWRNRQY